MTGSQSGNGEEGDEVEEDKRRMKNVVGDGRTNRNMDEEGMGGPT